MFASALDFSYLCPNNGECCYGIFSLGFYTASRFVRRNPVTCLVILILAVARVVLVGIANFIFYVMLTILLLGVVFVLLFRYRVNKLRREMGQQGGFSQEGPRRPPTYTWYSRRDEGDVKVYKTSDTPEKRINDSVGEYVEFEEVEEQNPKK